MAIAATAAEAFERYKGAFDAGLLTQGSWHTTADDGRNLACALGVLGDEIGSARDCPAQIMPRWLAQMVPWFFDNQPPDDARSWGLKFYAELKRLNGVVPFSVVHDWHANVVALVAIEMAEKRKRDPAPHVALQALHKRALSGDLAKRDEWTSVLRPANANADAYAYADADADAYAYAYADANAYANADAYAYADADADAYAYANADAYANANANAYADAYAMRRVIISRYANGMVDCLARVSPEVVS